MARSLVFTLLTVWDCAFEGLGFIRSKALEFRVFFSRVRVLEFRGLGVRGFGFRGLGFRGLGFRGVGVRGLAAC